MKSPMRHSDVVFMYTADPDTYKAYKATWVAWGGASEQKVKEAQALGIHYAASMWTLTAGAENLHKNSELRDAVCKDIFLEPIAVPWLWDHTYEGTPSYFGCTNNPTFREFSRQRVISAMETGADGLHIDDHLGSAGSFGHGGCFCDFCMTGFREFLKSGDYKDELEKYDVDITQFNYRDLLRKRVSTLEEYRKKRNELPLIDAFHTYQVKAASDSVQELREVAEKIKGAPITCSANTFMPNPVHLVVTPKLTHCVGELDFRPSGKNPPEASSVMVFKVMDAIGKSMAATASGWNWAYAHANNNAVGLVSLWIAECCALGHRLMAPHRKWAFTQEKGTHWYQSKPGDFAYLYHFIRENADLLDDYEPYSDVVVIFCNKSIRRHGLGRFQEVCKKLADDNIQFSVVTAGDDWLEDRLSLDALKDFDTVIVPEPAEFNDKQNRILKEWENFQNRKVEYISSTDDITNVDFDKASVKLVGASDVWALPRSRPNSPLVCHILNRNYDTDSDSIIPVRDIEIYLSKPFMGYRDIKSCRLISPGGESVELEFSMNDEELRCQISELGMWSIMTLI
jgi:hypothetical protein